MINLVDTIDQASLNESIETQRINEEDTERRTEEIREQLKRLCIEIESKGLAECRQTDITSHVIKMTDSKPMRHKSRPVPYHCREEFQHIIPDQLAAGIIKPSTSATCSPMNIHPLVY